tara:strand:- start:1176 stop:1382 length:207 start_codon:yes stop_codon:yes gene_type:complete
MIIKHFHEHELLSAYKAASSSDKKYYQKLKKKRRQEKLDLGPAAIINIAGQTKEELFIYDRFGKKKKF